MVTITGGTGSFGSTMAMDLLSKGVGGINIFSRDEAKQDAMRRRIDDARVRYFIGDVRDADSVQRAVRGADFVFHAAALKQVPSCEFFPEQAVKTNVRGSYNVIEAAAKAGVRSVVCLSTDKAVYPVNAMGMTKALMEKTAQAFARNNPNSTDHRVADPLRQRDVLARLGDPAVHPAVAGRQAADADRTADDPFPDVAGAVGRPRLPRLLPRRARATCSSARPPRAPSRRWRARSPRCWVTTTPRSG